MTMIVEIKHSTTSAGEQALVDCLTRGCLRWQRPHDNAMFPRMAELMGIDFAELLDDDHEDALLEDWERQGWEPSEIVAGCETVPVEVA